MWPEIVLAVIQKVSNVAVGIAICLGVLAILMTIGAFVVDAWKEARASIVRITLWFLIAAAIACIPNTEELLKIHEQIIRLKNPPASVSPDDGMIECVEASGEAGV